MDRGSRNGRERPSFLAVVMLFVGIWAVVATSSPPDTVEASGTVLLDALRPAAQLTVSADAGSDSDRLDLVIEWTLASESGVEPELSVVGLGSTLLAGSAAPLSMVYVDGSNAELELSVTNIEETGPVTLEWNASASLDDDGAELAITGSGATGRPSGAVSLPTTRGSFSLLSNPFTVFEVEAVFEPSASVRIERTDRAPDIAGLGNRVRALVGGQLLEIERGTNDVPTESANCADDRCVLAFSMVGQTTPQLDVDAHEGAVTALARQPASAVVWIALPPLRLISQVTDVSIDVAMPGGSANPLADQAILVVRVPDADDPLNELDCFAPASYSIAGQRYTELVSFVTDDVGGRPVDLVGGRTTRVDLRLGTTDPGQFCDVDANHETVLEIGVMTLGLEAVPPAEIALR